MTPGGAQAPPSADRFRPHDGQPHSVCSFRANRCTPGAFRRNHSTCPALPTAAIGAVRAIWTVRAAGAVGLVRVSRHPELTQESSTARGDHSRCESAQARRQDRRLQRWTCDNGGCHVGQPTSQRVGLGKAQHQRDGLVQTAVAPTQLLRLRLVSAPVWRCSLSIPRGDWISSSNPH